MKRNIIYSFVLALVLALTPMAAVADPIELDMVKGYATAYNLTGTTASGEQTRLGICASCSSHLGCTIILYQRLPDDKIGDVIGIYECKDTGGSDAIKDGKLIDVWRPDLDSCQAFMDRVYEDGCKGHVWIQVIPNMEG